MTAHQEQTLRALLAALIDADAFDGGLIDEPQLHGAVLLRTTPPATLTEFEEALHHAEKLKWIVSQRGKYGRNRWTATDLGRIARREP